MSGLDNAARQYTVAGLGGLAVALFLTGAYTLYVGGPPTATAPEPVRAEAPVFDLERLDGSHVRLNELRGQVVLVDFWATWCPPCRAEMPGLVQLAQRSSARGVKLVAISEDDPPGQRPLVTEFASEVKGLDAFAVLGNPDIEARYEVTSLPTLFIIDRRGRIADRLVGAVSPAEVERALAQVIGE
jgi:thiol-disulfide isomerase/thioredoxin